MFTISANYLDRKSEFKYLIKEDGKEPVAYKQVEAFGITMQGSSNFEEGFGCSTVIVADVAQGYFEPISNADDPPKGVNVVFDGGVSFVSKENYLKVLTVKESVSSEIGTVPSKATSLSLRPEGIWVVPLEEKGRTYTITDGEGDKKVYKGFNRNFRGAKQVILVSVEGDVETWATDEGEEARKEFIRYLDEDGVKYHLLGVYRSVDAP